MLPVLVILLAGPAVPAQRVVQPPMRPLQLAAPRITGVAPSEIAQGQTVTLTLTGSNIGDGLVLSFGPGVTAAPVTNATGTTAKVTVAVAADAVAGARTVEARIGGRLVGQPAALTVRPRVIARPGLSIGRPPAHQTTPAAAAASAGMAMPTAPATSLMPNATGVLVEYDRRGCPDNVIPCLTNQRTIYVEPGDTGEKFFWWNVERVPGARAARWQLIDTPLVPAAFAAQIEPAGILRTGVQEGTQHEVGLDIDAIARELKMVPVMPGTGPGPGGGSGAQAGAASAGVSQRQSSLTARTAHSPGTLPAGSLYFRVVPLRSAADPLGAGRPSEVLRIVYGREPPQHTKLPDIVYTPGPSMEVTKFEWVPYLRVERWPSGCEDIPRDTGTNAVDVAAEAFGDAWDWASHAYADIQSAVVDVAQKLLPMVPRSWLTIAMQGAMMAAGLPPSIPNLDQVMNAGSDYLVETLASQIPVPGSDVLAGMTVEEFKSQAKEASRQAIHAAEARARAEFSGANVKYCQQWIREPFLKITVRNTGHETYHDVWVGISDTANLFRGLDMPLAEIPPGQSLTLPVVLLDRTRMNIVVHDETQLASENQSRADERWWDDFSTKPFAFTVTLPGGENCMANTCVPQPNVAYTSAKKVWYNEGAVVR